MRARTLRFGAASLAFAALGAAGQALPAAADAVTMRSATPAVPTGRTWALRLPSIDKVTFRGGVSYDTAGLGTSQMMYAAPNAGGLLMAIGFHGLLNSGLRQIQKNHAQGEADEVLKPYEPVLGGYTHERLMREGLGKMSLPDPRRLLPATETTAGGDWLIESAPVFSMTQDQRALVLDNVLRIFAPGASKVAYAQTVRVVSMPLPEPEPAVPGSDEGTSAVAHAWLDAQGKRLTDESAALFAESLDVALLDAAAPFGDATTPHKTFRYRAGGAEKMERAQLVTQRCGRTLIRTLRGWLMSIPVGPADGGDCGVPAAPRQPAVSYTPQAS